jgi:hypothetical protein
MVTAVPAFFGSKAQTRKPSAVDLTILFDESGSNFNFIAAFKNKANITAIENSLVAEGVGVGTDLNRYRIGGFLRAFYADFNASSQKTFINSGEIQNAAWGQNDAGFEYGENQEDETGAIFAASQPIFGLNAPQDNLRPVGNNIGRITISQSTEESAGVYNGSGLDALMRTNEKQRLVFIDGGRDQEPQCSDLQRLITIGTVPSGSRVYGFVFTGETEATVIFSPSGVTTGTQLSDLTIVKNISKTTLSCEGFVAGRSLGPNQTRDETTNVGHYANLTGGAVLALSACTPNFPLAFEVLGKILGELLFDQSL